MYTQEELKEIMENAVEDDSPELEEANYELGELQRKYEDEQDLFLDPIDW